MKNLIKFVLPAVLPAMVLLAVTGCNRQPVDGYMYNPSGWEKLMKNPALSKSEFTQLYALAAAAEFKGCQVFITGRLQITLVYPEGGKQKVPLDALWTQTVKDPANRSAVCRRHLDGLAASKAATGALAARVDPSTILPVIWGGSPPENGRMVHTVTANGLESKFLRSTNRYVAEPFVADLCILYTGEREGRDIYLTEEDRNLLHLDLPALHKLAVENLTDRLPGIVHREPQPPFTLNLGGKYAASLLLADTLWNKQASLVRGELIAAAPANDSLIFTGTASPGGADLLRRKAQQVYAASGDDAISKTLLVRRNGKWQAYNN